MGNPIVNSGFLLIFKNNELTDFAKVGIVSSRERNNNSYSYSFNILERYCDIFNPSNKIDIVHNSISSFHINELRKLGHYTVEKRTFSSNIEFAGNTFVYIDNETFTSYLNNNLSEEEFVNILRYFVYTHTKFSMSSIVESLQNRKENKIDINNWKDENQVEEIISFEDFNNMILKLESYLKKVKARQNPFTQDNQTVTSSSTLNDSQDELSPRPKELDSSKPNGQEKKQKGIKPNGDIDASVIEQILAQKEIDDLVARVDAKIAELEAQEEAERKRLQEKVEQKNTEKKGADENKQSQAQQNVNEIKQPKEEEIRQQAKVFVDKIYASSTTKYKLPKISYTIDNIKRKVIGQDEAVAKAVLAVYQNQDLISRNPSKSELAVLKNNILMSGPSGCGKTEIARQISDNFSLPVVICDTSQMSGVGWGGDDATQVLARLYIESNRNIEIAEKGVLVLDEIDKKAVDTDAKSSNHNTLEVQQSLLKLIEGGVFDVKVGMNTIRFDTKYLTIISSGAFNGFGRTNPLSAQNKYFTELDYINYGLMPEFVGRHKTFITLRQLSYEDKKRYLMESELSILKLKLNELAAKGINVNIEGGLERLCEAIITKSDLSSNGECGVRDLNRIAYEIFNPISYCIYDQVEPFELCFDSSIVTDPTKFSMKVLSKRPPRRQ